MSHIDFANYQLVVQVQPGCPLAAAVVVVVV